MHKILVTTGLPYSNGPLHLGHILENIQADIWVRWQKILGNSCLFISGEDAHGTPIMLSAEENKIAPEDWVANNKVDHEKDLSDFYVNFDNYYTTHSDENRELTTSIYQKLQENGDIIVKEIEQAFDPIKEMFLPDRFIKGTCPRCKASDQYGDNCEKCGATYDPLDLIDPVSKLSGAQPIRKVSEHYFFDLEKYTPFLKQWINENQHLQKEISNKLGEWFKEGLKPWDISRDKPYFGFPIPGVSDKYFYVWLDAPIGYMASFENLCHRLGNVDFNDYWGENSPTELYHFVGKDIVYFHALFWPAVLKGAGFRQPTAIFTHGFITVNGQKMSKSRGTFITARLYLENLNPEYFRYYLAAKLSDSIDDFDFNTSDFAQRVNSDLVGKIVNIASRCAGFISKHFSGQLATEIADTELFNHFVKTGTKISQCYIERKYSEAIREIMSLADSANQYIDTQKPWQLAKDPSCLQNVQKIASMGLNLFRLLMLYLKPILPKMAQDTESFLNIPPLTWKDRETALLAHQIIEFKPLMQRIDLDQLKKIIVQ